MITVALLTRVNRGKLIYHLSFVRYYKIGIGTFYISINDNSGSTLIQHNVLAAERDTREHVRLVTIYDDVLSGSAVSALIHGSGRLIRSSF